MIANMTKEQCTGCNMCGDICPVDAIQFETDEEGFWYPVIDAERCIGCKKCENRCPSINSQLRVQLNTPKVYSAWS